ncbi:MAG TPA: type I DNA topoisomerase [Planctomycetota bacterium]|nr:type I DNA topoisomerase [Planctomycetota bacterium]
MATKKSSPATKAKAGGKPLVIVESPAKARTIGRILGPGYRIEASIGHIRDLPANAEEVPASIKGQKWARLGIDIDSDFKPHYVVPKNKREQIKKLKEAMRDATELYLATDEDREGESISWHLLQELKPKVAVKRLVFHEITEEAIREALAHPRGIDENLVEAQETRRIVDRLYGYSVSPLLWKKIRPRLSAGRVQSVAVRLIVERERERMRFVPATYFDLDGTFVAHATQFSAALQSVGGRRIASGKDFDPDTGKLRPGKDQPLQLDQAEAEALVARLRGQPARVESVDSKPYVERPSPPFTTSTLQQEAGRKLRFTAQRTMRAAQRLYENGFITYMRTDSTNLANEALEAARAHIKENFGAEHLPPEPRLYRTKVRNAQEAHEAIRPAGSRFKHPRELPESLGDDERKIYDLIWKRTIACQMKDAHGQRTSIVLAIDDARFLATGKTIEFPGFRLAYVEDTDDPEAAVAEAERILPSVRPGEEVDVAELNAVGHTTQPPPRLTEATLVKELEARGIGRPSTYASIIETIQTRDYVFKKGTALVPTFTAFAVTNLLGGHLPHLVDYDFTAKMEGDLDEISNGAATRLDYLRRFYHGNGQPGLRQTLVKVDGEIDPRVVCGIKLGEYRGQPVEVRIGRYGPFLACGDMRTSLPDETPPDELTLERAIELLEKGAEGPKALGTDPETGLPVYVKTGRFGPYLQLGDATGDSKPKMASLLPGMSPETIDLETALQVLALPRTLGVKATPEGVEEPVVATNGRFGPYVKWGKETRSIPPELSPLTITLEAALELLAQPKRRGRQAARAEPKVLKELGSPPDSDAKVRVLDGRYGAYVTDGTTNASLPRDESVESITLPRALELLAERAARGPARKRPTRRRARTSA